MSTLKLAWKALTSRPVVAAVAVVATLLLAGEWRSWLDREADSGARPARPTKAMRGWKLTTIDAQVQAPAIPPEDLDGARRRWHRPDLVAPPPQDALGQTIPLLQPTPRPGAIEPLSGQPSSPAGPLAGQIQRAGAVLLAEGRDTRPGPVGYEWACFLETDGRVTAAGDPLEQKFIGFPLRWRAWASYELGAANPDIEAGLAFRALRVGRIELAPALAAGRRDGASEVTVRAVAWFDF